MKKGPNLRWSLIQCSGGDEGDRTPDLLTASQALSQLSYAPVTRRYYMGMFLVVQGLFWTSCYHLRVFLGRWPLLVEVSDSGAGVNLNGCRAPDDVADAGVR